MFSEIDQEEIINRFLDNIYVNDTFKIMKNDTLECPCKMEDEKVELAKLNLPNNLINNICKFNYQKCQDCKYLWELPKIVERKDKCKVQRWRFSCLSHPSAGWDFFRSSQRQKCS